MSRIATAPAFLLALVLAGSSLILGAPAMAARSADGDVTWSVEPAPTAEGKRRTFQYGVDPGTQITDNVVITNAGTTPADFVIYATDAINDPDTGAFGLLAADVDPTDVGGWITLADEELTLQPGTQATVPFTLLIPSDAAPGEHIAGIVASVLTAGQNEEGAAITLEQRVGARVYLDITGAKEASVELAGVTSSYTPSLNPFAPGDLTVTFEVRNTGNQRVDVLPTVAVTGPFGLPLGTLDMKPVSEILPRQSVRVVASVPAIAAFALVFSQVTAVPVEVGTAIDPTADPVEPDPSATPTPTPTPTESAAVDPTAEPTPVNTDAIVETETELAFEPVSQTTPGFAISWTLLALLVLVVAVIFLIVRYVGGTRERLYLAIDEAAETARREALADRDAEESK
jgi:hypothetical protein